MARQVWDWVLAHEHRRADAWFAQHPPADAEADELFALNLIGAGRRGQSALARRHLERAFDAQPPRVSAGINLVQLLLEAGEVADALRAAERCAALAPGHAAVAEKLFLALHANRRWERCLAGLAQRPSGGSVALQALRDETQTCWWRPRELGSTSLRKPQPADEPRLEAMLADEAFRRRYHRQAEADAAGVARFIQRAALPPLTSRRLDWVACGRSESAGSESRCAAFGLVSLVDIDWPHRRAELMVGCRAQANPMAAAQATVMAMQFAFDVLGLAKLSTSVYGDNPEAQANVRHLGFVPEGVLRGHLLEGAQRIDVHQSGLLRPEYQRLRRERSFHARWASAVRVIEPTREPSPWP